MSDLSLFFKKNKAKSENTFFPATKSLCGEDGKPLLWEIRRVSSAENEQLQSDCIREVPVPGKPHQYRPRLDSMAYINKLVAASVVYPDLLNAALQDSYGVKKPEGLLKEMIDNIGEYNEFALFVQQFNGLNASLTEDIDEAKN